MKKALIFAILLIAAVGCQSPEVEFVLTPVKPEKDVIVFTKHGTEKLRGVVIKRVQGRKCYYNKEANRPCMIGTDTAWAE